MGCSSAFFLTRHVPPSQICIVERDPTYKEASTVLSVGSIRQQFSLAGNILLSLKSSNFLREELKTELAVERDAPPDIQFSSGGYLFLASKKGEDTLRRNYELQRSLGANIKLMDSGELGTGFPWLCTDDLAIGTIGQVNEGWFDPWLLLSAFKKKLLSLGVQFVHGEVTGLNLEQNKVKQVQVHESNSKETELGCDFFVNSAGPHAAKIAKMANMGTTSHPNPVMRIPLPVSPRKRQVFVFHCPRGPAHPVLVVDPSGAYFRRESQDGMYIAGISPPPHKDFETTNLEVDYNQFDETLWPILASRVPEFESLKVKGAWAGLYDYNTFDQNAILGPHAVINNFIFVNGFSGHGIQQSPEVGKAISEYIVYGKPNLTDLDNFGFSRILEGRKLLENNIV